MSTGAVAIIGVGLAALIGALGSLAGVWLTQRGERERREHDAGLRALDHAHELRQSLRDDRARAYERLASALRVRMRAHEELALTWAHRHVLVEQLKTATSTAEHDDIVRGMNATEHRFRACLTACSDADRNVDEALDSLEIVASSAVADAARALAGRVGELWNARREFADAPIGDIASSEAWIKVKEAQAKVEAAWGTLRAAIRQELRLDE